MNWFGRSAEARAIERLEKSVQGTVEALVQKALSDTQTVLGKLRTSFDLEAKNAKLREDLETLKIEKGRKEEEYERRDREIEHKVGLERKRQEQELTLAKREAVVTVNEANLAADRKRFEEQMAFHEKRFTAEVGYLKEIVKDLAERLPSASMKITRKQDSE